METSRPLMFIGSSTEGLSVARALQAELEHDVDAKVWDQGVFGLSLNPRKRRTTGMKEGNGRVLHRRFSESRWPRPCVGDP